MWNSVFFYSCTVYGPLRPLFYHVARVIIAVHISLYAPCVLYCGCVRKSLWRMLIDTPRTVWREGGQQLVSAHCVFWQTAQTHVRAHGIQLDNSNQLQSLNYQHIATLHCTTNYLLSHDTNPHIRVPSHSIKVVMAELRCENDCISIGVTLWIHRAVLCMLMRAVKTDLQIRRGGLWAVTIPLSTKIRPLWVWEAILQALTKCKNNFFEASFSKK